MLKKLKNQRGMSLLEIMIVLGIIGTIVAMLAGRIGNQVEKSKVKETKLAMNGIISALEMYNSECNSYPKSLEGLITADDCKNWGGPYLKGGNVLKDSWGEAYIYETDGGSFTLMSYGKDKKEGGSDMFTKDITQDNLGDK